MSRKEGMHFFIKYIGVMLMFVSGIILLPVAVLPFFPEENKYLMSFFFPFAASFLVGFLMNKTRISDDCRMTVADASLVVVASWFFAIFFSSLPFVFGKILDFPHAFFESASGWTTTGLSVVDVEKIPRIFLLFRSLSQFFGGLGIVLVVVSALSETLGMTLFMAEGHTNRLLPNLAFSARMIIKIYFGYFIAGTVLYMVLGMTAFEAVNHTMTSLSTGGFSTRSPSIGYYDSIPVEILTIILMFLGSTSFNAHMLLMGGKVGKFFRLSEFRLSALTAVLSIIMLTCISHFYMNNSLEYSIRTAVFNSMAALTTTGFSTTAFDRWPDSAMLVMVVLMSAGGQIGSTAGGIKLERINVVLKEAAWSVRRKFMPEYMANKPLIVRAEGSTPVTAELFAEAATYVITFMVFLLIGTLSLTACGYSLRDSLFEFASALGTVGLSTGITRFDMPPAALWTLTVGMILGRLEIYVIFYAFMRIFKK
ncbi:MAG: TrkH family potassium uptake protein [Sedimentibacter sp.]|uniref:TrkH family potassium uptake protein n=1 Tax=Sedimentibacter sp. TaxID=1960295 RepID=UPI003158D094